MLAYVGAKIPDMLAYVGAKIPSMLAYVGAKIPFMLAYVGANILSGLGLTKELMGSRRVLEASHLRKML